MSSEHDKVRGYFRCSDAEHACFEAGIKLGALFHQFVGVPLNPSNVGPLEEAMKKAILTQPYVVSAEVHLDRTMMSESLSHFGYCTLEGRMMDASVEVEVEGTTVVARLRQVDELKYPLMWIEKVGTETK